MLIRAEQPADRDGVARVVQLAFGDEGSAIVALVDDLRAALPSDGGFSLVAVDGEEVVGHVMFTRNLLDAPPRLVDVLVLSPLAVLPNRQRAGTGSALVREGLQRAAAAAAPAVFLEGSPDYYGRLGFRPGGEHGFRRPSLRIPPAAFQVVLLPAYEPWMTGTLVYREDFWRHDAVGLRSESAPAG